MQPKGNQDKTKDELYEKKTQQSNITKVSEGHENLNLSQHSFKLKYHNRKLNLTRNTTMSL